MVILVASCDKNTDTFEAFRHCIEKYWKNHPEIIYATETVKNPFYKTISHNVPLEKWTKRMRKTLDDIDDKQILLMIDDCFIRDYVDENRIKYCQEHLTGNVAVFNFEKSYDEKDEETELVGFKKRQHGSAYEVSLYCGLWQKDKLYMVLEKDSNPWEVEGEQNNHGFDYYINSGDFIINWGYEAFKPAGIFKGKWCTEIVSFFEKEGITVDYNKRGLQGDGYEKRKSARN